MLLLEPPPLGTVSDLKLCIEEATKVNVHDQVFLQGYFLFDSLTRLLFKILFLTGGETASPEASLQNLDAGTDTNPVFLFRRIHGPETAIDFSPSMERDGINELYQGFSPSRQKLTFLKFRLGNKNGSTQ
jgi:hypothetical protein